MAATLGDSVRLNKIVTSIESAGEVANVRCMDGTRYRADFVISALPFTTLSRVAIDPPPQGNQAEAIRLLPYRANSQVHMRVTDRVIACVTAYASVRYSVRMSVWMLM